ncbi:hypothetical protein QBC34DRAFT_309081 [Podospora aff. communis PSN243]|uniref:Cyclochlorotine biosynthesis protein O n=1 Tax=Podospora aff. communis PSN243 TaxID=3040156 RepID=A0AAV9G9X2_9PEZI|nr:hypothetical protein QBC34DRAFT_309081 [Podospora aff. communis PSN243]
MDDQSAPFLPRDGEDKLEHDESPKPRNISLIEHHANLFALTLFFLSAVLLIAGIQNGPSFAQCTKKLNGWSPMLEAVENYDTADTSGAVLGLGTASSALYVGYPTSTMEEAWDALWEFGSLGIPESQLPLLNKTATEKDWHRLPDDAGGGIQAYFEGFHYIHCLNLARQYTYRDEYNYSHVHAFHNPNVGILDHVEHCLEMLRVRIMCDADPTMYPVTGDDGKGTWSIDTRPRRMCRDFGKMAQWANEHITVPLVVGRDV